MHGGYRSFLLEKEILVSRIRLMLVVCLASAGLALPGAVGARGTVTQPLVATVGTPTAPNAYAISLRDSTGTAVTHLDPGTYTINVHDYATLHNFDLSGPGVSKATDIEGTTDTTWTVTFANGKYTFQCDAHPTQMHGAFTAGTVTTPPPVKKLAGQVGPKSTIALKSSSGARVKRLTAGKYRLTVKDLTRANNFHLRATGINKKTGVKFRGTVTWTLTFRAGKATYRSDANSRLRSGFVVVAR
jgi:plastocyanin